MQYHLTTREEVLLQELCRVWIVFAHTHRDIDAHRDGCVRGSLFGHGVGASGVAERCVLRFAVEFHLRVERWGAAEEAGSRGDEGFVTRRGFRERGSAAAQI